MSETPSPAPETSVLDNVRRLRRLVAFALVFDLLVCAEHWIRDDRFFPLWAFLFFGASCVWMIVSFTYMERVLVRKARRDEDSRSA
jgi:hypothetical protein